MKSSYSGDEVEILLKDITGLIEPLPTSVRERYIQSGTHYCEMLPLEYVPSDEYMETYNQALEDFSKSTAIAIGILADKLYQKKGEDLVIVSLARAGIPIGILLRRYLYQKYRLLVKHYAVSIIRGKGIDKNAIRYILDKHRPESIQFIDGWVGKGAIYRQLKDALEEFPEIDSELGVVSDPSGLTELCGTHEDILIPSSCLNATVTGLISRTFLRSDIIGENDFHGAVYYKKLEKNDLSEDFLSKIQENFDLSFTSNIALFDGIKGETVVHSIMREYQVNQINYIKPGIGEATRVLLRRVPWKIIVNPNFINAKELRHIYQLSIEKNIPYEISKVSLGKYKVCGIIRTFSDI